MCGPLLTSTEELGHDVVTLEPQLPVSPAPGKPRPGRRPSTPGSAMTTPRHSGLDQRAIDAVAAMPLRDVEGSTVPSTPIVSPRRRHSARNRLHAAALQLTQVQDQTRSAQQHAEACLDPAFSPPCLRQRSKDATPRSGKQDGYATARLRSRVRAVQAAMSLRQKSSIHAVLGGSVVVEF